MRWMEQCAYISAFRLRCGTGMLTACMDSVTFANPTRIGDILYITSQARAGGCWAARRAGVRGLRHGGMAACPPPWPAAVLQVSGIFGTSLEVNISVFGETPSEGKVFHCAVGCRQAAVQLAVEGMPASCWA
jgi:acyl-CoA hydrolase